MDGDELKMLSILNSMSCPSILYLSSMVYVLLDLKIFNGVVLANHEF